MREGGGCCYFSFSLFCFWLFMPGSIWELLLPASVYVWVMCHHSRRSRGVDVVIVRDQSATRLRLDSTILPFIHFSCATRVTFFSLSLWSERFLYRDLAKQMNIFQPFCFETNYRTLKRLFSSSSLFFRFLFSFGRLVLVPSDIDVCGSADNNTGFSLPSPGCLIHHVLLMGYRPPCYCFLTTNFVFFLSQGLHKTN